ncbi:MAG: hypothetical protein ACYSU0_17160 [Planctomycetota bacterium]|jgi:hypothetical protein
MNKAIHSKLTDVARQESTITYSELGFLVDLDMNSDSDRAEIGRILDEISTHEHEAGRPLLSAVVTCKDGGPGKGFYRLARELGMMTPRASRIAFWSQELGKVYDHWAARSF